MTTIGQTITDILWKIINANYRYIMMHDFIIVSYKYPTVFKKIIMDTRCNITKAGGTPKEGTNMIMI